MLEFLKTPAGQAVFGVVTAAVLLVIIDLNYKIFMKAALDFLFGLIALIFCSPVLAVCSVISKKNAGKVLESTAYLGGKGKIIRLSSFAGINGRAKNLPYIFGVLSGKISFVGVKPLPVSDGALIEDDQLARFTARPGLICHLSMGGDESLTYEEMFDLDARYAKRRELFTDVYIAVKTLVLKIRGEGKSYFGEAKDKSYGQALLARGAITEEDLTRAVAYGEEAIEKTEKFSAYKKSRYV